MQLEIDKMDNLCKLLQNLKENPVLYLGQPSLVCLDSFLTGYLSARFELDLDQEGTILDGFQKWMQEREGNRGTHGWARIILFSSVSERGAFYKFFELLTQFLHQNSSSKDQKDKNENQEKLQAKVDDLCKRKRELYELLSAIKKRPGMYLGNNSITRLDMFLRGYIFAQREFGIFPIAQEREFEGFQSWIEEKYGIKSGQSWAKIILFFSIDEQEALEKFFELFEEFLNQYKSSELIARSDH